MNSTPKILLYGLNEMALVLGRACSLSDNPVVGIYHPDPSLALKASLFLGVSALTEKEQALATKPDLVICAQPPEEVTCKLLSGATVLNLYGRPDNLPENTCRLESDPALGATIPDTITSAIPNLCLKIHGAPAVREKWRVFLQSLNAPFSVEA